MKKIFAVIVIAFVALLSLNFTPSSSSFCDGWKDGYKAGYCYQKNPCSIGLIPRCPMKRMGEKTYKDGYNRGFLRGKKDSK